MMKTSSLTHRAIASVVFVLLGCLPGVGQTTSGSVSGTVVDSQGAIVSSATVVLTEVSKGLTFETHTNDAGGFVFAQTPPGNYTVTVEASGFKKLERTGVVLNANAALNIGGLAMEVGSVSESIEVHGAVVALQTDSAERSEALVSKQIENIAVNGRSPLDLAKLVTGVVSTADYEVASWSGLGSMSANGERANHNFMTIDGITAVDPGGNGTQNVTLSIDAVQEFRVLTGVYQAEYGRSAGMQVAYVTKGGTSEFHGSAFWYGRNNDFNANNWLDNRQGLPRPEYRFNDPGYTIGGPIFIPKLYPHKDKLFFFWGQEYQRQIVPSSISTGSLDPNGIYLVTVPTALERQGNFSQSVNSSGQPVVIKDPLSGAPFPGNIIPASRLYQPGIAALNFWPLPNTTGIGFNYQSELSANNPRREDLLRIDYNLSSSLRIFAHWIRNVNPITGSYGEYPNTNSIDANVPITPVVQNIPAWGPEIGATWIINPTTTNEFNVGASHHLQSIYPVSQSALTRTATGIDLPVLTPSAIQQDYMPALIFGGSNLANSPEITTGDAPFSEDDTAIDVVDNFSKVHGTHLFKAGIFIERNGKNQYSFGLNNGSYNFGDTASNPYDTGFGFSNAALGVYNQFQQANTYLRGLYHYTNIEYYLQDTWKITQKLTLDYGLRMAWYQPWFDSSNQASTFVPKDWSLSQAPLLYQPALVGGQRVALNPVNGQTLPASDIGYLVPGTGSLTNGILQSNNGISRYLNNGPSWVFGPRLGVAWSATDNIVVRAGAGIFHDRDNGNRFFNQVTNPPESTNSQLNYGFAQDIGTSGALLGPPTLYMVDPTAKIPDVVNYTFGVQSKLPKALVLDVAYVGSQSRHLQDNRDINAVPYGAAFLPQNQDPTLLAAQPNALLGQDALSANFLRPYRGYSDIILYETAATANYNSLQTSLSRRVSNGLFFGADYTWSHNLTTAGNDTLYASFDQDNRKANYGNAAYDRRQVFRANYVYDIPRLINSSRILHGAVDGWQISGVTTFSTGAPYTPGFNMTGVGTDLSGGLLNNTVTGTPLLTGSYSGTARLGVLAGCNPNTGSGNPYNRINASCFTAPTVGSIGEESGQNVLTAPGLDEWDLSLQKAFTIRERVRTEFRVDAFNAFNHTQFTAINNVLNFSALPTPKPTNLPYSAAGNLVNENGFGTVSAVANPRILQLMLRIQF
jgi:Carboxypeptidase regulatory-like domain/TonB-dependent Receptor Plug Domain